MRMPQHGASIILKDNSMITFVLQPFHIGKESVQFQIFVDSSTRHHSFVGINGMTHQEWFAFRKALEKGAKTLKTVQVDVHPAFEKID